MKLWELSLWILAFLVLVGVLAWIVVVSATRPPHDTYKCMETSSVTFTCEKR